MWFNGTATPSDGSTWTFTTWHRRRRSLMLVASRRAPSQANAFSPSSTISTYMLKAAFGSHMCARASSRVFCLNRYIASALARLDDWLTRDDELYPLHTNMLTLPPYLLMWHSLLWVVHVCAMFCGDSPGAPTSSPPCFSVYICVLLIGDRGQVVACINDIQTALSSSQQQAQSIERKANNIYIYNIYCA